MCRMRDSSTSNIGLLLSHYSEKRVCGASKMVEGMCGESSMGSGMVLESYR